MTIRFRFNEMDKWHHYSDMVVPPMGECLVSDGMSTWIVFRDGSPLKSKPEVFGHKGPDSEVIWWRPLDEQPKNSFLGLEKYLPVMEHIYSGLGIGTIHTNTVVKPWGSYTDIIREAGYVVKTIAINPDASLSLQRHADRNEFWLIIAGTGQIQLGKLTADMKVGQTIHIHKKEVHRATNIGDVPFIILELQYGDDCSEEDIERLSDIYGRG